MTRTATLLLILPLLVAGCSQQQESAAPPNIIFIMADDHAYQAISAYSDHLMQTPNIDRIASEGMLFTNACVTNSICAPSRAVILTGKHSHINGKIDNRFPFDTTQVTFPQLFQAAGYQTAMFGKLHFGNNPKGIDEFKILPGQGHYYNPDFITNEGDIKVEGYTTDIITDMTLDWMKNRRDPEKPFLLFFLHKAPHREWLPAERHFREYIDKTFPEPPTLFDDYAGRGTAAREAEMNILLHQNWAGDSKLDPAVMEALGIEPSSNWDTRAWRNNLGRMNEEQRQAWEEVYGPMNEEFKKIYPGMSKEDLMRWRYQRYMQDYLACIAAVDEGVGDLLDYLDETGLSKNTVVVYTSDQGFYLGEHGWFDKRFIYNESFKTPLLVRWPGVVEPGSTSDQMVQNLDFAQTFLDMAGIEAPDDMQGESIVPLLKGEDDQWDRDAVYYHYYEYPAVHMVKRHYGIVTREYKLAHFYYDIDEWELYDRIRDPLELKNEVDNPDYAEVVADLKDQLEALRVKYKDSRELDQKFIDLYEAQ
jgi:arylsulfatase A-like enzyme